jgi:iron complex outermembrane receptor protein
VYLAEGGLSPYASYSESFEPVAPEQGTLYKPQRGRQFEVGIKWQPASPRLTASAAAYQLRERNRKAPGATPADPSVQRGEVTVTGLELEAAGHLPAWDLLASYTYANARVTRGADNELDQQLYGIPRHSAALWALHRFGSLGLPGLRAGLGVRHIGTTGTGDAGVPVTVPAYDRGDWRFALNANNLSDKTYIAACLSRGDCWFGAKRKVIATVAYRF